ncbi:MAG TPA: NAD(P)-binding domain-containing protein, partial [Polyangiaceae bacterium]|nr:NAD(P)-binding domain-containing protein [Polyangiaceae bacterium]
IGATVGRLWSEAGHHVRFGTRHPEQLGSLVESLGARASAGTPREAAEFGEVILLAVPLKAVPELAEELLPTLRNKTVLDASNPYPERDGESAREAIARGQGSSKWTASKLPGVCIVKAFNMQRFDVLQAEAHHDDNPLAVVLASDNLTALGVAKQLVHDAGFEPVIVGSLEEGRAFDPGSPYYAKSVRASDLRRDMAEHHSAERV